MLLGAPSLPARFLLASRTAALSFIVDFGVTQTLTNYFAGRPSYIRKVVHDALPDVARRDRRVAHQRGAHRRSGATFLA
ncbi:MAG TPA: hypothetical protein DEF51_44460 [Myxococcales bacterium]|nr:hypothetical protein [Myxococcales bacterium]